MLTENREWFETAMNATTLRQLVAPIVLAIFGIASLTSFLGNALGEEWRPLTDSQRRSSCGAGTVFAVLRSMDFEVELRDVVARFSKEYRSVDKSVPMSEMCMVLREYGLSVTPVRYDVDKIAASWAPSILLLNSPEDDATAIGHYVMLRDVHDDRIFIVDPNSSEKEVEIPLHHLPRFWSGYAIMIQKSIWPLTALETTTLVLALFALIMLVSVFRRRKNTFGRLTLANWFVLIISSLVLTCASCENKPVARLEFENNTHEIPATNEGALVSYSFPFRVQGSEPVTVTSIEASCGCAACGKDIIGKPLLPNRKYKLPVKVETKGTTGFNVGVIVRTDRNQLIGLTLKGVVESVPIVAPAILIGKFAPHSDRTPSGTFTISRVRAKSSKPLKPAKTVVESQGTLLTLLQNEESEHPMAGTRDPVPVLDTLKWRWELTCLPSADESKTIDLAWDSKLGLPPTKVKLQCVAESPVRGLVTRLYCSRLVPNERWSHTMHLALGEASIKEVKSVESESPSVVNALVEPTTFGLTRLQINVQAPNSPGKFQAVVNISFDGLTDEIPIVVYGHVVNP